jgi:hypothetical protein
MIVTFKSGRTHAETYGPFTTPAKAREIRTRMEKVWSGCFSERRQSNLRRVDDQIVQSIRFITEILPSFGWHTKSDDTITAD